MIGCALSDETSIHSFIRFDAISTDAVDSLAEILIRNSKANFAKSVSIDTVGISRTSQSLACNRGGTIPPDTARITKSLLPVSATNQAQYCYKLFCKHRPISNPGTSIKRSVLSSGSISDRVNNSERDHTVCFRMPKTKHHYIALTVHAFKDYVSDWIGNVNDFYILHSRYLDRSFEPFSSTVPLESVLDSNKEQFALALAISFVFSVKLMKRRVTMNLELYSINANSLIVQCETEQLFVV